MTYPFLNRGGVDGGGGGVEGRQGREGNGRRKGGQTVVRM